MTANSKNTNIHIGTNFVLVCGSAFLHEEEDAIFSIFQ